MPGDYRPDDSIIENDFEVDRWFEAFLRDQARAARRRGKGGGNRGGVPRNALGEEADLMAVVPQYTGSY